MTRTRVLRFLRREFLWLALGLAAGFLLLPWALYEVGSRLLGPYAGDGRLGLTRALMGDFLHLRPAAWLLLLGPLVLLWTLRVLLRGLRAR